MKNLAIIAWQRYEERNGSVTGERKWKGLKREKC
jgi:hypothetical protein